MFERSLLSAGVACALAMPFVAHAADDAEIRQLRAELDALRNQYEARIRALEARLARPEAVGGDRTGPVASGAGAESPAAGVRPAAGVDPHAGHAHAPAPLRPASPAAAGATASSQRGYNPDITLILSGRYARLSRDPETWRLGGLALPGDLELGPGERGFSLGESELGITANVDPYLRGLLRLALTPENTIAVEEANVETLGLGHGLAVKAGRFYSAIGYLNEQHPHQWDFVDAPLAYQGFLGRQFGDDGVQLRWVAPTDLFVELAAEAGRGRSHPASGQVGNGAGAYALAARVGGDVGASHSWRAGLSLLNANARDQRTATTDLGGAEVVNAFDGRHRVAIADFVWKWAPDGNPARRNFKLQGEYLRRSQSGTLTYAVDGPSLADAFSAAQTGWYLQGVWQFMPRWRVGARFDRIARGRYDYGANGTYLAADAWDPRRSSLMVDYSPTEYSRFRVQLARDESRPGQPDNQLFLQYQASMGAHGAHRF